MPYSANGIHCDDSTWRCEDCGSRYGANANSRPATNAASCCRSARGRTSTSRGPRARTSRGTAGCSRGSDSGDGVDRQNLHRLGEQVLRVRQRQRRRDGRCWRRRTCGAREVAAAGCASSCSQSHARIHMLSSESPRSHATSRPSPRTSGQVATRVMRGRGRASAGDPDRRACRINPARLRHELLEEHLQDRRGRHGENRADDAEQRAADEQRDDDDHGADADLALHDLRDQHVVLQLLLDEEEDRDAESRRRRHGEGHQDRRNRGEQRPDDRDHLADCRPPAPARRSRARRAATDRARPCVPMIAAEQQLPAEPGAHLRRHTPAGIVTARAARSRKQPQKRADDAVGVDEQIERR